MKTTKTYTGLLTFRLLRWFCPPHLLEEIEGDLLQRYERDLKSCHHSKWWHDSNPRWAKRRLLWNTLRFFRPGILFRNKVSMELIHLMIVNYFKIAYRHLIQSKVFFLH